MKSFKEKTVKELNRYNHTFIEDADIIEKTIDATLSEVEKRATKEFYEWDNNKSIPPPKPILFADWWEEVFRGKIIKEMKK